MFINPAVKLQLVVVVKNDSNCSADLCGTDRSVRLTRRDDRDTSRRRSLYRFRSSTRRDVWVHLICTHGVQRSISLRGHTVVRGYGFRRYENNNYNDNNNADTDIKNKMHDQRVGYLTCYHTVLCPLCDI